MRLRFLALPALLAGLLASPVSAQSFAACQGIDLVSPAQGRHFLGTRPIMFQWSAEPVGTVSRELHLAALDGSETVIPLAGRFSDTVKVRMSGDLAWVVVFRDADGEPLCTSPAGLISAGAGGGSVAGAVSLIAPGADGAAPAQVAVFMHNGRLVFVLQGSPYTGQYTRMLKGDGYDLTNEDLMGATGIEFHGNDQANSFTGSPGDDLIYLYGGNDDAEGGAGDDILVGGEGDDTMRDATHGGDTDSLYGGPGRDELNTSDADALDTAYYGNLPVAIESALLDPGDATAGGPDEP